MNYDGYLVCNVDSSNKLRLKINAELSMNGVYQLASYIYVIVKMIDIQSLVCYRSEE